MAATRRNTVHSVESGDTLLPVGAPCESGSTSQLLADCRDGDAEAWNRLVERYERLVFSVALHNGLSREDAADVTQTVFVVLLESLDRIRMDESLGFWLMTVSRRNAWRIRKRRQRESLSNAVVELPDDPVSAWDDVVVVHEALEQLAPPCRELILALYFDPSAPSYAEIAARMDRAPGGIGPLRARCLERLRALMEETD
jgi:RNA polymerase sigma factor (sigma-70 family)